jgi:hypothetical protein
MLTLSYSFIGHGFDIHRMAPLELAGQPVVIGGVEITHKDQKVTNVQVLEFQSLKHQVDSLVSLTVDRRRGQVCGKGWCL